MLKDVIVFVHVRNSTNISDLSGATAFIIKVINILISGSLCHFYTYKVPVPDKRNRDLEVAVVRRIINLGTDNLEWGGNGKGLRKGRSVYE